MSVSFLTEDARVKTLPPLSNEIFGLIIESLGEDVPSLRSCSLVSSVFHHFCSPTLFRNIELDRKETLETFLQLGAHSDSLIHTKSLRLTYSGFESKTHLRKPRKVLDMISQKVSLETLRLHHVQLQAEPFTASLLSKLSTVTVLALQQCCFGGFEDFVSFIRCFPRCQVLRLYYCTWAEDFPNPRFRSLPTFGLAPAHLEITSTYPGQWRRRMFDQGRIVGMPWLDLTGLKSFTYAIQDDTTSGPLLGRIITCGLLEEVDLSLVYHIAHSFAMTQLALFIVRIKSLTLRCYSELLPWWPSSPSDSPFPSSSTLERLRIITTIPFSITENCRIIDNTFSDTDRYPSLVELEVCSFDVVKIGWTARDKHARLSFDEHLPRLRALGRLPTSGTRSVESVRPVDTFGSVADAYYKDTM